MYHLHVALLAPALLYAEANPPARCIVRCQVASSEYAKMGGVLRRSIVWVLSAPDRRRVTDVSSPEHRFALELPPGDYILQCTGVGSRGATFQPTYRPFTVQPGADTLDLDTIDMPISEVTRLFGKPAPELTGVVAWKNTKPVTLKENRGKVVVLDFWGHYCSICIHHMPELAKLAGKYQGKLTVLTVHDGSVATLAEMEGRLREASRRKLGNLPVALDCHGAQSVFRAYGIHAVPAVILIDPAGKVVRRFHHAGDPELDQEIAALLQDAGNRGQ